MITRRLLTAALAACVALPALVHAAELRPFTPDAFAAAQAAGRPILVHVAAGWCTVCARQKPILAQLEAQPRFKDLAVFAIDFDTQKEALRQVGARMQSTLIAYKGTAETARSVGETQPEWIEGLVEKAY